MRKDLCIFGLDLMVIFVECTGVYRGIGASKRFDGDAGCVSDQLVLSGGDEHKDEGACRLR